MDPKTKYDRKIYPKDSEVHEDDAGQAYIVVDVYDVLEAFEVTNPASQHAIKKLLCAGLRGKGPATDDVKDAGIAVDRALDLELIRRVSLDSRHVHPDVTIRLDSRRIASATIRNGRLTQQKKRR